MPESTATILIVDDSRDFLETIAAWLEDHYTVACTDDPHQALNLATDQTTLLLSDVMMPLMSGPELADRMVAQHPAIKVLLMTGVYRQPLNYPVIFKPFSLVDLSTKIRQILAA